MNVFRDRFAGQSAIVTGGCSGIGLAVAQRLTDEGARVSVWDISQEGLGRIESRFAHKVRVDQSNERDVERAAAETIAAFGSIDVLVVSAGITGPISPVAKYPLDAWREVINVNLTGAFLVNRAIAPHMVERRYGRIVNVSSVAGKEGNPNASAYSASKAAVIALTKSLAKELAETGVSVTAVTPAAVRTAIFDQMTPAHIEFMLSKIPAKRFGTVDEVAAVIAWLASRECSFSTGAAFDVSGGRSTY